MMTILTIKIINYLNYCLQIMSANYATVVLSWYFVYFFIKKEFHRKSWGWKFCNIRFYITFAPLLGLVPRSGLWNRTPFPKERNDLWNSRECKLAYIRSGELTNEVTIRVQTRSKIPSEELLTMSVLLFLFFWGGGMAEWLASLDLDRKVVGLNHGVSRSDGQWWNL